MIEKLILVLSEHRAFGWRFYIYSAQLLASGSMQILGIPNTRLEAERGASEEEMRLIRLIEEISDQALMKAYSKKKSTVEFKNEITKDTFEHLVRPRIENNIRKVVEIAKGTNIPIFLREDLSSKTLYERYRIHILPEPTECLFNFVKDETGLKYYISLTNEQKEILLQTKPGIIIAEQPSIILLGNQIHRIKNIESKKIVPFFERAFIEVPASSEEVYLKNFVVKTMMNYEVKLTGIPIVRQKPSRHAVLSLQEDLENQPVLLLSFQYDDTRITPGKKSKKSIELKTIGEIPTIHWYERDSEWESGLIHILLQEGLEIRNDNQFYIPGNDCPGQLIEWINQKKHLLPEDFKLEQETGLNYYTGEIKIETFFDTKIDWFDVNIIIVAGPFRIPFSRFRKHILTGNNKFVLPDKTIMILPSEWFERYYDFFLHSKDSGENIRLKKMHAGILKNSLRESISPKRANELEMLTQIPDKHPPIPPLTNTQLRTYQKEGFYWLVHLYNNGFGGCLADDMGLGKTLQTISLLQHIYSNSDHIQSIGSDGQLSLFDTQKSNLPASLVVAPTSLLHNWYNELRKFSPDLKVYIYAGNKRIKSKEIEKIFNHYPVVITSYGTVRKDIEYLCEYYFQYIILDESQYIKNPNSNIYHSIKSLNSSHKLALTGTPIENSLEDLWAQFNFINEGLLGNYSSFKKNYIQKIIREKSTYREALLKKLIQPFILRRTKEEVAPELPPLIQEIIYCDMTEDQQNIYNSEKNRIRNNLMNLKGQPDQSNHFIALEGLNQLRQLANHPSLIQSGYTGSSGKFDQIIMAFETLKTNGHKVLIFSSYVKHLNLLAQRFDSEKWKYALLTGETRNRESEIARFSNDKDIDCFFISLKAGGTGLNLTAADYVFIVDPWWNPAAELQALSRAHRIGQKKNVIAYRFISSETIEEKIIHLQNQKSKLSESFINTNNPFEKLSIDEIYSLID